MSDSDDTDDLLLIPPDLFVIPSEFDNYSSEPPYFNIVDKLISQVSNLDCRVNLIERTSDSSLGNSLDYLLVNTVNSKYPAHFMSINHENNARNGASSTQQPYIPSTHSTPQKPKSKLKLNSLPSTPTTISTSIDRAQITSALHEDYEKYKTDPKWQHFALEKDKTQSSPISQDKMLNEINSFISNVHTIKKYDTARSLKQQFDLSVSPNRKHNWNSQNNASNSLKSRLNLNDVNDLLHSVENKQRNIELRLKQNESQLNINKDDMQLNVKKATWRQGDTLDSVPDYGMGMRNSLYNDDSEKSDENNVNILTAMPLETSKFLSSDIYSENIESAASDNATSVNSSSSTQLTAYNKGNPLQKLSTTNLNQNAAHNQRQDYEQLRNEQARDLMVNTVDSKSSDYHSSDKEKLALINLSELWSHTSNTNNSRSFENSTFFNKLQEEKLRRKHCEQMIQNLQVQSLEFQEQLAVAIEVDNAKDEAILRVHSSWKEASIKIENLIKSKIVLEGQLLQLTATATAELSEASKKMKQYEDETFKAINLAHSNQEKIETLEKENNRLFGDLQMVKDKLKHTEELHQTSIDNNNFLKDTLNKKENDIKRNEHSLSEARKEVSQSKQAVEVCHKELSLMKEDQNRLELKIDAKLDQIKVLEIDKTRLLQDIENYKRNERTLKEELRKQSHQNEKAKLDLRNFYQNQVEIVVQDKLKEFQAQLDKAESTLHSEIRNREMAIAKSAALYIQQIVHKHDMEIHLLEEKHKEEIKLYQLRLSQLQQQVDNLHYKFQQQQESRTSIAQKLHKVMEAQWLEALKIINNGKSVVLAQDKSTNTIDQLNSLKSKSFTNVEEILEKELSSNKVPTDFKMNKPDSTTLEGSSFFSNDELYDQNMQLKRQFFNEETPLTSKPEKNKQQMENELQKYINLLLNKTPGALGDISKNNGKHKSLSGGNHSNDYHSALQWQKIDENDEISKNHKGVVRERSGKPPWK